MNNVKIIQILTFIYCTIQFGVDRIRWIFKALFCQTNLHLSFNLIGKAADLKYIKLNTLRSLLTLHPTLSILLTRLEISKKYYTRLLCKVIKCTNLKIKITN